MGGVVVDTGCLIIGGGVSGLALAALLEAQRRDWRLFEAQDDLGGRVRSPEIAGGRFDLGPAWFWPGQPRIAALTRHHALPVFEQFCQGDAVFQRRDGAVERHRGFAPMRGALRISGGMGALIEALARDLPAHKITRAQPVKALRRTADGIIATHAGGAIGARQVVLAVPPRVAAQSIAFTPALDRPVLEAMRAIPTWMAGQAKILAVYDTPHWRNAGLSGDGMSEHGPMVELHDASVEQGGPYALFGFVGVPPDIRARHHDQVIALALAQLEAMFGPQMAQPLAIRMMDWAQVPEICTPLDHAPAGHHPSYGVPRALRGLWGGALELGSSETAASFGGYLEGALEAAERVATQVQGAQG